MFNLVQKSDQQLLDAIDKAEVAQQVLVAEQELVRRGLLKLNKSSQRLEWLTGILILLTVVLALLTAILAVPELKHPVSWFVGH